MRIAFYSLFAVWLTANGGAFTNESPANSQSMKVIWAVPTNIWPMDKIWTYKVIQQEFSDVVVSNAMAIGTFTMNDKKNPPEEMLEADAKAICFVSKDKSKYLKILPTLGYIEYYDGNAEAKAVSTVNDVPEPIVGVPNLAKATRLGLKYARLLGIDPSHFAKKRGTQDFDLHWEITSREWTDQKTKKEVREIQDFGIDFTRSIDGIEVSGFGDLFINFANNAQIQRLKLSWRKLQPYQLNDNFVAPEEIVKAIQSGQTPLPRLADWPIEEIKTLTITNAVPRYSRKPGDQPMDFVVPALQLDAIVDNGKTNRSIWFQTSIFSPERAMK